MIALGNQSYKIRPNVNRIPYNDPNTIFIYQKTERNQQFLNERIKLVLGSYLLQKLDLNIRSTYVVEIYMLRVNLTLSNSSRLT